MKNTEYSEQRTPSQTLHAINHYQLPTFHPQFQSNKTHSAKMFKQTALNLALTSILTAITTAFPLHFPPPAFTDAKILLPDQIPSMASDPAALSSWTEETPSIHLCQLPHFAGECLVLEDNAPWTCLNLDSKAGSTEHHAGTGSVGLEVGSLRVGGERGCVLFG
jgi:hypothetical protein